MAVVGAAAGFVFMLSIDFWKRPYTGDSFLLESALLGGCVGAILGFVLTDSQWLELLRKR